MKNYKNDMLIEIKKIPISYYSGVKIEVALTEEATSFCDMQERKIYISTNQFKSIDEMFLNNLSNEKYNSLVRGVVYHELSHIILTPLLLLKYDIRILLDRIKARCRGLLVSYVEFKKWLLKNIQSLVNILEDERIETIFKNVFLNVNFKSNIKIINNYKEDEAIEDNPMSLFYNVVRFNNLKNYKDNRFAGYALRTLNDFLNDSYILQIDSTCECGDLFSRYLDFLSLIALYSYKAVEVEEENKQQQPQPQQQDGDESEEKEEQKQQATAQAGENGGESESESESESEKENPHGKNDEAMKKLKNYFKKIVYSDDSNILKRDFSEIIKKYNKNGEEIGGRFSYSGRIDPKKVVNNYNNYSYKIFKKAIDGEETGNSTLNINLIIDASGSFIANEKIIQKLLKALFNLEEENRQKIKISAYKLNNQFLRIEKPEQFVCVGSTYFNAETLLKIKDLVNKENSVNIALFDGDIGDHYGDFFKLLNDKNNYIIYEKENKAVVEGYAQRANKTYIESDEYASSLIENIKRALEDFVR